MFHKEYRMLAFVPRWGITPRSQQQSVAEHSYFVIVYVLQICKALNLDSIQTLEIVQRAANHDLLEIWTGDTPGPAKKVVVDDTGVWQYEAQLARSVPDYSIMLTEDLVGTLIIKLADLIDEVLYLTFELETGNRIVQGVYDREFKALSDHLDHGYFEFIRDDVIKALDTAQTRIREEGAIVPPLETEPSIKFDREAADYEMPF